MSSFSVGDRVEKISGYLWPGEVVAVFRTTAGKERVVVECKTPIVGTLHIYSPEQLKKVNISDDLPGEFTMTDEELAKTISELVAELNAKASVAATRNIEVSLEERSVLAIGADVEVMWWKLTMRKILV